MANKDELSQKLAAEKVDAMEVIGRHKFRRDIPYNPPVSRVSSIVSGGNQYDEKWCETELKREWELAGGKEAEELASKWYKENIDMIKKFQSGNK